MDLNLESNSTLNAHPHLKEDDTIRLYNTLAKAKSSNRKRVIMRHMIDFPSEHSSTFSNLIERIAKVFDECHYSNYNNACYKEFKKVLSEFQESLSDSGEPVRFTFIRKRTPTSRKRFPARFLAPLPPSENNLIYNITTLKIQMFIQMILNCNTRKEKREFLEKYLYVLDATDEPFPDMVNDIIIDILETPEIKMEEHFKHLMYMYGPKQSLDQQYIKLYILYPFQVIHPSIFRHTRSNVHVHNLGGGKRRHTKKRKMKH